MSTHSKRSSIISPGSVALADILANSVAVLLILILATLVNQQESAREEIERNTDITTILARQLATTVVFNDLPSNPPAILHDYNSCDIPHDCDPMLFPVLELHQGYLRIFNTNTRIYRSELRRESNAFDRYLASLPPAMREAIRIDIHSISEYYLVIGIMQEHGLLSRHWHYLGEHVPGLINNVLAENTEGISEPGQMEPGGTGTEYGDGDDWQGTGLSPGLAGDAPPGLTGTQLGGADILNALNYDSLLPPSVSENRPGALPSGNPIAPWERSRGGSLLDGQGLPGPLGSGGQTSLRLFVPNASTIPISGNNGETLNVSPEEYPLLVLSYVFRVLETARETQAFEPARHNQWLLAMVQNPQALVSQPYYALVEELLAELQGYDFSVASLLQSIQLAEERPYNRLLIQANAMDGNMVLNLSQATDWLLTLPDAGQVQPQFLLRPYPSLFKGEVLEVPQDYILLTLPDETEVAEAGWRPVAMVDQALRNVALGFVYAGVEQEQLAIHAGVNQLQLNRRPVANPILNPEDRSRNLTPLLWVLVLGGLLLLLRLAPRSPRKVIAR